MQETQVRSLGQEDATHHRATTAMSHNYGACALEPMVDDRRSHRKEKPAHHHEKVAPAPAAREKACNKDPAKPK